MGASFSAFARFIPTDENRFEPGLLQIHQSVFIPSEGLQRAHQHDVYIPHPEYSKRSALE